MFHDSMVDFEIHVNLYRLIYEIHISEHVSGISEYLFNTICFMHLKRV